MTKNRQTDKWHQQNQHFVDVTLANTAPVLSPCSFQLPVVKPASMSHNIVTDFRGCK